MIIIWGRTIKKTRRPDGGAILGSSPPCPMRNCRGVVQLYDMQRYCHMYWIPCFPEGELKEIVQCNTCRALIDLQEYKQYAQEVAAASIVNVLLGGAPNKKPEEAAKDWLDEGRFDKAEFVARAGLQRDPRNINLMCQLDVALNGLGKAKEADKLACQIVYHWETHCRRGWIASGRPEGRAAFPRVMLKQGLPDGCHLEAKQYFEPQKVEGLGTALYKVLIYPKGKNVGTKVTPRILKLLHIPGNDREIYALKEFPPNERPKDAILYSEDEHQQPDIRKVISDVAVLLGNCSQMIPMLDVSGLREELPADGKKDFKFFDAAENDPRALRLKVFVVNADWRSVRDFFAALLPEQRSFWMDVVCHEIEQTWSKTRIDGKMSHMLDMWKQSEPDSVDCRLIRLETYVAWAWNARTAHLACAVSDARFAEFHKRLMEAAKEFEDAKELCASDPMLYSCGITIARGLGRRVADIVTMEQCQADLRDLSTDPLFYRAHVGALQYYCRKWHGSHEKMFEYANSITGQLPDGHPLWVLIPMAHFERVLIEPVDGYWQRPQVKREILDAYQRAFPTGVASAVTSAPHMLSKEWTCRNYFAYCMIMTQQYEEARHQIRVIGKRPIQNLWGDYRYFVLMLGFDVETGPLSCWEDNNNNNNNNNEGIPLAQAKVMPEVATMPVAETMNRMPNVATTPVVAEAMNRMPVAEVKLLPEVP